MGKRPTIADVAARAGVDRAVVSKVVNADPALRVREDTRQRVEHAITELGYRTSSVARSLRTAHTGALGIILPSFINPIWAHILEGAEAEADQRDYTLLAGTSATGERPASRFLDLTRRGAVDGVLIAAALADDDLPGLDSDIPWLLVNRRTPSSTRHVLLDDEQAAYLATQHLIDLGHHNIGHLAGPTDVDSADRRRAGYHRAMTEHGLPPGPTVDASYTMAGGETALHTLLDRTDPPSATMIANIASAAGALAAARQHGVTIPDDMSVIALHDLELANTFGPPLTTVRMPLAELGRRAVELLLTRPAHDTITETIPSQPELIPRESTRPHH